MTPEDKKLKEIEAALLQLGYDQRTRDDIIKKIGEYTEFLTLPFTVHQFIAFAGASKTNENIKAAIEYTKLLMDFGYTNKDICSVGSLANGHTRLKCLRRYHQYLISLKFKNDDIVGMLTSQSGQRIVHAIIATYDTLMQLGFNITDVMTIVREHGGLQLFASIEENKNKFVNMLPKDIIQNVAKVKNLTNAIILNDPKIDYASQMEIKSEELLEKYFIAKQNPHIQQSIQSILSTYQPATRSIKDLRDEVLSENKEVSQSGKSIFPFLALNAISNTTQQTSQVGNRPRLSREKIKQICEELRIELLRSRYTEEVVKKMILEIEPYVESLYMLKLSIKELSRMAGVKNKKVVVESLLRHHEELKALGYTVNDLVVIVVRESGEKTLLSLLKYHETLTNECYGFTREQIIDIVHNCRGEKNLLALIDHYAVLKNKLKLTNEDIVKVLKLHNGHENIKALINYYDILIKLGYNTEQIVAIASMNSAKIKIKSLIAYHSYLKSIGFKHEHLITIITSNNDASAISYLYYFLKKDPKISYYIEDLNKLMKEKNFRSFMKKEGIVLPTDYYEIINDMANTEVKKVVDAEISVAQATSLMPAIINQKPLQTPAVAEFNQITINYYHHKTSRDAEGKNIRTQKKSKQVKDEIFETSIGSETQPVALLPYLENLKYRDAQEWRMSTDPLSSYSLFAASPQLQILNEGSVALQTTGLVTQSIATTSTQQESTAFNIDDFLSLPVNPELDELMEMIPLESDQPPHVLGNH